MHKLQRLLNGCRDVVVRLLLHMRLDHIPRPVIEEVPINNNTKAIISFAGPCPPPPPTKAVSAFLLHHSSYTYYAHKLGNNLLSCCGVISNWNCVHLSHSAIHAVPSIGLGEFINSALKTIFLLLELLLPS